MVFAHEVWSNDTWCPEHAVGRVTVTTTDEREPDPRVRVSPTTLTVTEGDTTGEIYRVRLETQPSGPIRVDVSGHDDNNDVRVSPDTLTFTSTTWNAWQDVQVTVVDDVDADNDPDVTLTHTANGTGFSNVAGPDVTVRIRDDETASSRVTLTVNPTGVSEGAGSSGETVTVTATLNNAARTMDTEVTVSVDPATASAGDFEDRAGLHAGRSTRGRRSGRPTSC